MGAISCSWVEKSHSREDEPAIRSYGIGARWRKAVKENISWEKNLKKLRKN